jgi:hypothetical protein
MNIVDSGRQSIVNMLISAQQKIGVAFGGTHSNSWESSQFVD